MYIFGARLRYRYGVVRNAHTGLYYYCVRMDLIISEDPCQELLIGDHGINTAGAEFRFIFTFEVLNN